VVAREGAELLLPCHPADALALGVRARAPIMAQDSALALARPAPPSSSPAPDDVQGWLDRVSLSDETPESRLTASRSDGRLTAK
jgi:hypothetical protein